MKAPFNYRNLSAEECFHIAYKFFENADKLYYESLDESATENFGQATFYLTQSLEQTARGLILFLDSKGFQFRKEVEMIDELFLNHSLHSGLTLILSVHHVVAEDLEKVSGKILSNPEKLNEWTGKKGLWISYVVKYLSHYIGSAFKEVFWYTGAGFLRQKAFSENDATIDFSKVKVSEKEFNSLLERIETMRIFIGNTTDIFNEENEIIEDKTKGLIKTMKEKDLYSFCNRIIIKIKENKANPATMLMLMAELFTKKF